METPRISTREIAGIVICLVIGLLLFAIPPVVLRAARQGLWLSMLSAMAYDAALIPLILLLHRRMPGQTLYEHCLRLLGPIAGRLATFAYTFMFLHTLALALRNYAFFFRLIMPETPDAAFVISMAAVAALGASLGLEVIARSSLLLAPLAMGTSFAATAFLLNRADPGFLLPLLPAGVVPALAAGALPAVTMGVCIAVAVIAADHPQPGQAMLGKVAGLGAGALTMLGLLLISIATLGPAAAAATQIPIFSAIRMVEVGRFVERLELLYITAAAAAGLLSFALLTYVTQKGVATLFGLRNAPSLAWPVATLASAMALGLVNSRADLLDFLTRVSPFYGFTVEVGLTGLLAGLALFQPRRPQGTDGGRPWS